MGLRLTIGGHVYIPRVQMLIAKTALEQWSSNGILVLAEGGPQIVTAQIDVVRCVTSLFVASSHSYDK